MQMQQLTIPTEASDLDDLYAELDLLREEAAEQGQGAVYTAVLAAQVRMEAIMQESAALVVEARALVDGARAVMDNDTTLVADAA